MGGHSEMTEKNDDFVVHQSEKPQFMPQLESQFSQLNNRVATTGTASGAGTACSAAARLVVEGQTKCSSWWGDKAGPKHNISTENGRDTYCCTMLYMYRDMKRNIRQDSIRQNSMILVWILLFFCNDHLMNRIQPNSSMVLMDVLTVGKYPNLIPFFVT